MGTRFRQAVVGAIKDSTTVGLANLNSDYKELDIAIVKATNHVEFPPKERHMRTIFHATTAHQPRADVAYCIHKLSKRLYKTKTWIVAIKTLIVIHRLLREGDPTFREELLNYSRRGHFLQIANFKDDSTPQAWDCSAWVRNYALFLQERVECFRTLKYDIETERFVSSPTSSSTQKVTRTRSLDAADLLVQLPALQQFLQRLIGCQPEGCAYGNYLVQYALALVLKESFKIYCSLNDGIINLVDVFFDMPRHNAVKALKIYKIAGQQAEHLAQFYEYCKGLDIARNFQFPCLRQPPPSFLATMEEYIGEAPHTSSVVHQRLEYHEAVLSPPREYPPESEEPKKSEGEEQKEEEPIVNQEPNPVEGEEAAPLIAADWKNDDDLLGLREINPQALELEERNALALAIVQPGGNNSNNLALSNIGDTTGWELALVSAESNHTSQAPDRKMAGGFDKLLLDSLYEDENARKQLQLQNAGYGYCGNGIAMQNPFESENDPFAMSNNIAPPTSVQLAIQQQQEQMLFQQQQHQQQNNMMMNPYQQQQPYFNPFGDPLPVPNYAYNNTTSSQGNYNLM